MLATMLLVRQSRCLVGSSLRAPLQRVALRAFSTGDNRRLSEWDHIFFEDPASGERRNVPSSLESMEDDFGAYDYDPEENDVPEMEDFFGPGEEHPSMSSDWDSPSTVRPEPVAPPIAMVRKEVQIPPITKVRKEVQIPSDRDDLYIKASDGGPIDSSLDQVKTRLKDLEAKIYAQNNGKKFNIHSPKQVSIILFGSPDQSTNKDALEAMGGAGNVMADLILQHRKYRQEVKRMERKEESSAAGKRITSFSQTENGDNDPLLLVDASAYIFRAYYSMPPLHRRDGMPVGAVMGFCNMLNRLVLNRLVDGDRPRLVLVFDAKGRNFRHEMYQDYKANRAECPLDLVPQFDLIREAAKAYGIPEIEAQGYEADDVIATLATLALEEGIDTHILSGDKDLMQLVTPPDMSPHIHMIDPMSMSRIDFDVVREKWGVPPELVGDVLALAGDSSDNVPGVPGIGPKIAASLLEEFGSLDELLARVDSIKQKARREKLVENRELAILSRKLVDLERSIPRDQWTCTPEDVSDLTSLRMEPMDADRLLEFYQLMGFRELKRRLQDRLTQEERKSKRRSSNRRPKAHVPKPEDYQEVPF